MKKNIGYKTAFEWLESFAYGIFIIMLLFVFFLKIYTVVGESMYPTLKNGDKVVVLQIGYKPQNGDMIVVDGHSNYGKTLVKRIIAGENQTVNISSNGDLSVDNILVDSSKYNLGGDRVYPVIVPEDCLFVMGDNRRVSKDSRSEDIGYINEDNIMGKVVFSFGNSGK